MRVSSRKSFSSLVTYVIALGLVLRSFIAPGYMLDTSDGLAIVFCEGPAGAYASTHQDAHHGHHGQHGDEADTQSHFTPSCTHWSTSGLLVIDSYYEALVFPPPYITGSYYQSPFLQQYPNNLRPNRGPPPFTV